MLRSVMRRGGNVLVLELYNQAMNSNEMKKCTAATKGERHFPGKQKDGGSYTYLPIKGTFQINGLTTLTKHK